MRAIGDRSTAKAPDRATVAAFVAVVVLGGGNAVAVRFSNQELAPFWGATLRFAVASVVLFAAVAARGIQLPRGEALIGSVLYGLFAFAGAFGLIYWGLVKTPAGLGQIVLALVPLLTFLFAVAQGLEMFRWQSVAGAVVALLGIAAVFGDRVGAAVPAASLVAVVGAAASMAESNVIVKRYPRSHPVANNAVAMGVGAIVLLALSLVAGEQHVVPLRGQTYAAIGYVSVVGSVGVFSLFLYVIARWTASTSSYVMLLMPLVTVAVAAVLIAEPVTPAYFLGGALVLGGVYLGAFAPSIVRRPPEPLAAGVAAGTVSQGRGALPAAEAEAEVASGRTGPLTPGCA